MYRAPRGTADILPEEQRYWRYVEAEAREVARGTAMAGWTRPCLSIATCLCGAWARSPTLWRRRCTSSRTGEATTLPFVPRARPPSAARTWNTDAQPAPACPYVLLLPGLSLRPPTGGTVQAAPPVWRGGPGRRRPVGGRRGHRDGLAAYEGPGTQRPHPPYQQHRRPPVQAGLPGAPQGILRLST